MTHLGCGCHHPVVGGPGLNIKEKVSRTSAFIALCFLTVVQCDQLPHVPATIPPTPTPPPGSELYSQPVSQNKPLPPKVVSGRVFVHSNKKTNQPMANTVTLLPGEGLMDGLLVEGWP